MAIGIRMVDWPEIYDAFKRAAERSDELHVLEIERLAHDLADILHNANGQRFKRNRFIAGCGFTPDGELEPLKPRTLELEGNYSTAQVKG